MSVCKPKSWAIEFLRNQKMKATLKKWGKGAPQQIVKHELQYYDFKTCLTTDDIE